ncbi:MAG: GTPase domain-containing protein [Planctomycetes bacterium]|nr:GTPase domain-containing protein [Planctomycetota bacterium]
MNEERIEQFSRRLAEWQRELEAFRWPRAMSRRPALREVRAILRELVRRWREGAQAPLRVAVFGPTGAGKSKLLSSLVGRVLSPSGYRRPFTRRPVYLLHEEWGLLAPTLEGKVELHADDAWRSLILIDSPDFDSVEIANRDEAERILGETDAFLFVVDSLKYGDASTWEYLDRLFSIGKPCWILLNKCEGGDAPADFRERLERRGGPDGPGRTVWTLPELAIDDETLIPADLPALVEVREALLRLAGDPAQGRALMGEVFRNDWGRLSRLAGDLLEVARSSRAKLDDLDASIAARFREGAERLRPRLAGRVDPAVRQEVYRRWLERIEKIDVLRYPRRIIALPFEGLRAMVRKLRGARGEDVAPARDGLPPAADVGFQLLEAEILVICEECRQELESRSPVKGLLTPAAYKRLRFQHEELLRRYEESMSEFREWVAGEAGHLAGSLTAGTKLKFILAQVIFNGVIIGAQIHTGGALSLLEIGVDSVVSPLVAKAVGMAISSDEVKKFELRVREEHHRLFAAIFAECEQRFRGFLREAGEGLDRLTALLEEIHGSAGSGEALCDAYARAAAASGKGAPLEDRGSSAGASRGGPDAGGEGEP